MSAPEVNIPLLRKAVEWAEAEAARPEIDRQWRQAAWVSTPEDVAWDVVVGTPLDEVGFEDGFGRLLNTVESQCGTAYCLAGWIGQALDPRYATQHIVDDVHVARVAADALGIDYQAARGEGGLFAAENSIEDVRRIAEEIAGERL